MPDSQQLQAEESAKRAIACLLAIAETDEATELRGRMERRRDGSLRDDSTTDGGS